ncbi:hypothetical protein FACS1894168_1590 [Deltaproteobacteria bacterium]|nr:hypothetical protein FACS1894168_1590 [Deltaproteobacteria bacterium]
MAVAPVNLGPVLRSFALAGLETLLFPDKVVSFASLRSALAGGGEATRFGDASFSPRPSSSSSSALASLSASPARSGATPLAPGASLTFAPRGGVAANPAQWPKAWADCFARTKPARILWTYHQLGADLAGIDSSLERSAFLKKLLALLPLSKGSSVFWPCAVVAQPEGRNIPEPGHDAALVPYPAIFSSGLFRLSPQIVIVFGKTALTDMALPDDGIFFSQVMVEGKIVVLLPDISDFLSGEVQLESAVSLLRSLFSSLQGNRD